MLEQPWMMAQIVLAAGGIIEPWMGQLGIGAASIALFLAIGKSYINSVAARVKEVSAAHKAELDRLEKSWESRLADMRTRAEAWEAAANRREETARELVLGLSRVESVMEQNIALLTAIREGQIK